MNGKTKYRIGVLASVVLVVLAVVCDLIGLIPFAKDITAIVFWLIADLYLWKAKVGFFKGKNLAAELISLIAGLIPVVQELPIELSLGIFAIIVMTRAEDKLGFSLKSAEGGLNEKGVKFTNRATEVYAKRYDLPLNKDGVRQPSPRAPLNTIEEGKGIRKSTPPETV